MNLPSLDAREIFGPVLVSTTFAAAEAGQKLANNTAYTVLAGRRSGPRNINLGAWISRAKLVRRAS